MPSAVSRKFFLLRSTSSDWNWRSSALMVWLTADWVTLLISAVLVKLSVSFKSQNTFKASSCINGVNSKAAHRSTGVPCTGKHQAGVPPKQNWTDYIRVPSGCYSVTACEWRTDTYDVTKIDLRL